MASPKPKNSGKSGKVARGKEGSAERVVAENRKARHNYEILDTLECGIALVGILKQPCIALSIVLAQARTFAPLMHRIFSVSNPKPELQPVNR